MKLFIGVYEGLSIDLYRLIAVSYSNFKEANFSDTLQCVSPAFITIYNESSHAEPIGLFEICGIGYGKALEF
jgi:hypothetical protein